MMEQRGANLRVRSNIALGAHLQPWERNVLLSVVSELIGDLLSGSVQDDGNTRKKKLERVVAYARVSTAEQAAKDLSIPAQQDALRRYANEHGAEIVHAFSELGASGRTGQRPIFRKMLKYVLDSANRVDAILVYQTSRFFRDAAEARALNVALRRKGVQVIAICQETEDGPMGSFMEGIFELVDQYESDVNGMRTGAAMRKNAQLGYLNGSVAPFGFKAICVQIGSQSKRKLVPNPDERDTVVELFRAYVSGRGAKAVAADLNLRGLRYRGGGLWRKNHVLRVISEPACVGAYYWGQRDSRTKKLRDKAEWIAIPVEPIVDQELYDMAQQCRKERDPAQVKGRTSSSPLLLAGVVCCLQCRSSLGLETSGKQTANGERPFRYYNCRRFLTSGKQACPGTRIPESKLDQAILEHLADKVFTQERCRKILEDVVEETGMLRRKTDEQRAALQAQLADIERRVARWQDAFETGAESADIILPRLRELTAKRDELASTLAKVVPLHRPPPHLYTETTLDRFRAMLRQVFLSGQTSMTKNYLRFLVQRIEIGPMTADGTAINIVGKTGAAIALMASAGQEPAAPVNPQGPVLSSVNDWLQLQDSNLGPGG